MVAAGPLKVVRSLQIGFSDPDNRHDACVSSLSAKIESARVVEH